MANKAVNVDRNNYYFEQLTIRIRPHYTTQSAHELELKFNVSYALMYRLELVKKGV